MGISSHQIEREFPDHQEKIRSLKAADPQFREKAERYMELDREIEGLERGAGRSVMTRCTSSNPGGQN